MTNEAVEPVGPSAAQLKKKANAAKWAKISGGIIAAVMVIRVAAMLIPKEIPHCNDSEVQSTASQLMNDVLSKKGMANLKVTGITDIKDGERADKLAKCTGTVTISDNSKGTLYYQVERGKGGDTVHITNVVPL